MNPKLIMSAAVPFLSLAFLAIFQPDYAKFFCQEPAGCGVVAREQSADVP